MIFLFPTLLLQTFIVDRVFLDDRRAVAKVLELCTFEYGETSLVKSEGEREREMLSISSISRGRLCQRSPRSPDGPRQRRGLLFSLSLLPLFRLAVRVASSLHLSELPFGPVLGRTRNMRGQTLAHQPPFHPSRPVEGLR